PSIRAADPFCRSNPVDPELTKGSKESKKINRDKEEESRFPSGGREEKPLKKGGANDGILGQGCNAAPSGSLAIPASGKWRGKNIITDWRYWP
ncbi:MAG: hypothetical protein QHH30_04460, partial [candidate division NC10 bacterium]|nr:hypothetical protein [candidate division NC10 bacterium]